MDFFSSFLLFQVSLYDIVESSLYIIAAGFSILLMALSISAYRNTGARKIKYAIAAFALFAVFLFYEFLEHSFIQVESPYTDLILPSAVLAIVFLYPESVWVSYIIHSEEDIPKIIDLFRLQYERLKNKPMIISPR
jgi:hypothetical protein